MSRINDYEKEIVLVIQATSKKRILIVHNYYQIPGGEDAVVINEKRLLEEHGHKVVLYTRHNREMEGFHWVQKLMLPIATVFNPRTYLEIRKIIKEQGVDVVHVHNTLALISPAVYYAALSCRKPVVQTMHNFRLLCPGASFYRNGHICEECLTKGLWRAVRKACYRNSRLQTLACVVNMKLHRMTGIYRKINYICLTEFNKEKLLRLNEGKEKKMIYPERIFVKPNFTFEMEKRNPVGENSRMKKEYYLFMGRIEQVKGISLLMEAFRQLQDKKLMIAGTGIELEHYKRMAPKNVEFKGYLQGKELEELLLGAKAVIVASQLYETFGMVIAEAYAAGKPVIAGNIGNMDWMVEEMKTGMKFKYDSTESLVETIREFEGTDIDWAGIAYRRYVNEFSPESNYRMLMSVYDEAMERK